MIGMKKKTIKTVLNKKIKNWLNTIEDENVRKIAGDNTLVCGGAISSMLLGEKPNDYDFYFKNKEAVKTIAEYYVKRFNASNKIKSINDYEAEVKEQTIKNWQGVDEDRIVIYIASAGIASEAQAESEVEYKYFEQESEKTTDDFFDALTVQDELADQLSEDPANTVEEVVTKLKAEKERYRPVFLSDNAITLSDKVQLIIRFYGNVDDIHRNFDFVHAMCSYDYANGILILPMDSLENLLSRNLVYKGSLYPIASIFRIRKFIERGFRIAAGELLKIIWQINELDLKDIKVLREQLTGVDMAYMHELISALEKDNQTYNIDSIYIAKLIDEIFE
jgi:hypothetical protein